MLVRLTSNMCGLPEGTVCHIQPFLGDSTYTIKQVVFGAQGLPDWYQCILQFRDFEVLDDDSVQGG